MSESVCLSTKKIKLAIYIILNINYLLQYLQFVSTYFPFKNLKMKMLIQHWFWSLDYMLVLWEGVELHTIFQPGDVGSDYQDKM